MSQPTRRSAERRVLVPLHAPAWGGIHGIQEALGPALAARGWPLLVALPDADVDSAQRLSSAGVEILPLPLGRFRRSVDPRLHVRSLADLARDVRQLGDVVRRHDVALVQVCGLHNVQGAIAARRCGRPIVWQLLSALVPRPIRLAMMPVVRRVADAVMTNGSGRTVQDAFPGLDRMGARWVPFFSPVDTRRFAPDPARRARMRERLGFSPDTIVVGTVGNRTMQKGHDILVDAAAQARSLDPKLRFCIVGAPVESNARHYERDVIGKARAYGLLDRPDLVIVDGAREIADFVTAFDIFTMTSRAEGIPLALIEAMAAGLPTVVPDVGGMAETSPDGRTGIVMRDPAAADYASAWVSLAADASRREAFGLAARVRAVDAFSADATADVHVEAFERAVAHHSGRAAR
mgnify:CR=1 FL=1